MCVFMENGHVVSNSVARLKKSSRQEMSLSRPYPMLCLAMRWRDRATKTYLVKVTHDIVLPVSPRAVQVQQLEPDVHLQ